uniref:Chemokine interleukin-8-like domain-containing protein n=1 Tax=Pseudonaja textilis TaxID=8673 RepID=A0A670ZJL1_PSETE
MLKNKISLNKLPKRNSASPRLTTDYLVTVQISGCFSSTARELRCHCVKVFSHGISIGSIASVDFIPEGPHCISLLHFNGKQFCLNTTMPWVQRVIQRFTKVFMKIV